MNRTALAVFSILGLVTALPADPAVAQAELHSKQLDLTGIAEHSLNYNGQTGLFKVKGNPVLHAVMPQKHITLDAANLVGHLLSGVLRDATLTGGVHGTLENKARNGMNLITFSGSTAVYTDKGTEADPAADIDASGGVRFQSTNSTVGSKFSLTGSHGLFQLRTPASQEMRLQNADLEGPVTYNFSGVPVGKDKKAEPSKGSGTAGHLKITRSGEDYVLHLSGGVSLKTVGGGVGFDFPGTESVTVVMDEAGNFKSMSTDESVAGTITPNKKS